MTGLRPDVWRASGRILPALLASILAVPACAAVPASTTELLPVTETVIGRASWRGAVALLTDAPALITIDPRTGAASRQALVVSRDNFSPWGLGEVGEELFTVSRFSTLVRLPAGGMVERSQSLGRPMSNLFDLPEGMGAQLSGEAPGSALAVRLSNSGEVTPFPSPARKALGLTAAEENLLHLLSCSVPPRVVCWLPNDNLLLAVHDEGLVDTLRLASLHPVTPADFIARLDRRLIVDALMLEDGGFVVLHEGGRAGSRTLSQFDRSGRERGPVTETGDSVRLLVHAEGNEIQALDRDGRLVRMRRR